jgi:hypothetical protein
MCAARRQVAVHSGSARALPSLGQLGGGARTRAPRAKLRRVLHAASTIEVERSPVDQYIIMKGLFLFRSNSFKFASWVSVRARRKVVTWSARSARRVNPARCACVQHASATAHAGRACRHVAHDRSTSSRADASGKWAGRVSVQHADATCQRDRGEPTRRAKPRSGRPEASRAAQSENADAVVGALSIPRVARRQPRSGHAMVASVTSRTSRPKYSTRRARDWGRHAQPQLRA